jgi:hypothetical protein
VYIYAKIHEITDSEIVVKFPRPKKSVEFLLNSEIEIRLDDGRVISNEQRRKTYATLRDIREHTGYIVEEAKRLFKLMFIYETGEDWFSLSDCSMTTARNFLQFLIEYCITNEVWCTESLLHRTPDIADYIYACLMNKTCILCGRYAEFHHAEDRVGMGRNRYEICHIGMRGQPLCRVHHDEVHRIGQLTFNELHHVFGIEVDREIAEVYKLRKGDGGK